MKRIAATFGLALFLCGCGSFDQDFRSQQRAWNDARTQVPQAPAATLWRNPEVVARANPSDGSTSGGSSISRVSASTTSTAVLASATPNGSSRQFDRNLSAFPPAPPEANAEPIPDRPPEPPADRIPDRLPDLPVVEDSEVNARAPAEEEETSPTVSEPRPLTAPASGPVVRLVNKKRITLNYEVKEVGPSGLAGVDLWYTRDTKTWNRHDAGPEAPSPYVIDVQEEGLYGFTLLARNGVGLAKEPPHSGDLPQVWVEVDLTKPVVQLNDVRVRCGDKVPSLHVVWKAADKNLGSQPIAIAVAEKEDGPWQTIAGNIENTGRHDLPLRPDLPSRFFVRLEAKDLAGNVGVAKTQTPVQVDLSKPVVSILDVEATGK
jgi:hypothetical protein